MATIKPDSARHLVVGVDAVVVTQHPLPEDHEFYPLIGRVAAYWAQLEHELDLIIWDLADTENRVNSCVTGQIMGHGARFRVIIALAEFRGLPRQTVNKINSIGGAVAGLAEGRNRFVHDAWFVHAVGDNPDDIYDVGQFRSLSKKNRNFGFVPITESDIIKTIDNIRRKTSKITELRAKITRER